MAALVVLYAAGNAAWLTRNGVRCVGSAFHARHFLRAAQLHTLLAGGTPLPRIVETLSRNRFYPAPLHSLAAAVEMMLLGKSVPLVTGVLNLGAFAAALSFIALLALELGEAPEVAVWAMVLYALYPAVYGLSRLYGAFDFQVAALMPLGVLLLFRARRFSSRRDCLLLAAAMSVGLLVKDTFAGYFGPPFAFAAVAAWRNAKDRRKVAGNILLTLAVVAAAVAVYYARPAIAYKEATEVFREAADTRYLLDDWRVYTIGVSRGLMSPPFFLLFLAGLAALVRRRKLDEGWRLVLAWIVVPWLIVFFMRHEKQPGYFVPILPAAALVSARFLKELSARRRAAVAAVLLAAGVVQYAALSFGGRLPEAYFKMDSTVVFNAGFPVGIDEPARVAGRLAEVDAREGKVNDTLILPAVRRMGEVSFYYFFDWLDGLTFETTGGVEDTFSGEFLSKDYDQVLFQAPPSWDAKRYARELYGRSLVIAKRNWMDGTLAELERTSPEDFAARLEPFLARYPVKEEVGREGDTVIWLLAKRSRSGSSGAEAGQRRRARAARGPRRSRAHAASDARLVSRPQKNAGER